MTDSGLPPFDARIKAQLDAQRAQLDALERDQREPRRQLEQALASLAKLGVPPPAQRMVDVQKAQQTRAAITAWRQDIADREKDLAEREKDLASRREGLRELEAAAERAYGIPAPPPVGQPDADLLPAAASSRPDPQPGGAPSSRKHDDPQSALALILLRQLYPPDGHAPKEVSSAVLHRRMAALVVEENKTGGHLVAPSVSTIARVRPRR